MNNFYFLQLFLQTVEILQSKTFFYGNRETNQFPRKS